MFFKKDLNNKTRFLFCSFKGLLGVLLITLFSLPLYAAQNLQEVNLYSARKEALIKPIIDDFSQQTGIKVNLITGKADALLQRIQSEGKNTHADVFITTDAGRLYRAKSAGVKFP